jgi:hypothetical protein
VHREADAVPERELEPLIRVVPWASALGAMSSGLEHIARQVMQGPPADPGPHRRPCALERLPHQRLLLAYLVRNPADHEGPGHVRPAGRHLLARPHVDHDRQVRRQRARSRLMTIALPHRGDDDLRRRRRTFVPACIAQHGPHRFCGEDLTLHHQAAAIRHRLAKQSRRGPHPRFRRGLRPADASQFERRLHPAPSRDRLVIHGQADTVGAKPVGHRDRHVGIGNGLTDAHRHRAARG